MNRLTRAWARYRSRRAARHVTPEQLEQRVADLRAEMSAQVSDAAITASLRRLGARTVDAQPHGNYFNERFRELELAILNVKVLSYRLGQQLALKHPIVETEPRVVPLVSRLCTQRDVESDWMGAWAHQIRLPRVFRRKLWEFGFVAQALFNAGKLVPGAAGLGFGCGEEPLPSLFAKYGAEILATDQAPDAAAQLGWAQTQQHATTIAQIRRADICPDPAKLAAIRLEYVEMNDIPRDLDGRFDFCWSACALEHLGSIERGLAFVENAMRTLKPGGIAVHTLEYNVCDDCETIDNWPTVLFQRKHMVALVERLRRAGHVVDDPDFSRGDQILDQLVDLPPWHPEIVSLLDDWTQLKLSVDGFICTSFGLIVQAAGGRA
jgi:SAM-dependent methyltransferase